MRITEILLSCSPGDAAGWYAVVETDDDAKPFAFVWSPTAIPPGDALPPARESTAARGCEPGESCIDAGLAWGACADALAQTDPVAALAMRDAMQAWERA